MRALGTKQGALNHIPGTVSLRVTPETPEQLRSS